LSGSFPRGVLASAVAVLLFFAGFGVTNASAGIVDRGFGDRGLFSLSAGTEKQGTSPSGLVRAEDGRFLVFGQVNGDLGIFAFDETGARSSTLGGRHFRQFEQVRGGGADWDMPERAMRHGRDHTVVAGGIHYVSAWESYRHLTLTRVGDDGRLDRSFGDGGTIRHRKLRRAVDAAVDPKQRIVTVSRREGRGGRGDTERIPSAYVIARFTRDGKLDRSFGDRGTITRARGWGSTFGDLTLDAAGRVIVTGFDNLGDGRSPDRKPHVIRYGTDGRPDPGFGSEGTAERARVRIEPMSVLALPGQKVLVSGERRSNDGESTFVRYLGDGRPDPAFGDRGVLGSASDWAAPKDLTLLADGTIAYHEDGGLRLMTADGQPVPDAPEKLPANGKGALLPDADGSLYWAPPSTGMPFIGRLAPDRRPDPAFTGAALPVPAIEIPSGYGLYALGRLGDGSLIGGVDVGSSPYFAKLGLFHLSRDGRRDNSFGEDGVATLKEHQVESAVSLGARGRKGAHVIASGPGLKYSARTLITPDGRLKTTRLPGFGRDDTSDVLNLPNGEFVVVGETNKKVKGERYAQAFTRVARYNRDGTLDRAFGRRGFRDLGYVPNAVAAAVTRDRRGRLVIAGGSCSNMFFCSGRGKWGQKVTFIRLSPDGDLDRGFGRGGSKRFRYPGSAYAIDATVLRDGRILGLLWRHCTYNCLNAVDLVSLTPNGEFDRGFSGNGRVRLRVGRNLSVAGMFPAGRRGVDLAGSVAPCGKDPEFSVLRLDRRGRPDRFFGGGDGLIRGRTGGFGATAWAAIRQSPGTVTIGGSLDTRNRYGGTGGALGLQRLKLRARDGRENLRPCLP
jgi:uncharacterized delta-60 repeat protein